MTTTLRTLLLAAVGAVALSACGGAQTQLADGPAAAVHGGAQAPFEQGMDAYNTLDFVTALRLWSPLAEQDDARAQYFLGLMYDVGQGVPEDKAEAVRWYRRGAELGYGPAQATLGAMYYGGERVPQNYIESYKWYALAAAQGVFWAKAALDQMQTDLLQTNRITPAQIAEGQKLAAEWKPKE